MKPWPMIGYNTKEASSDINMKCYFSKLSQISHCYKHFVETLIYFE